MSADRWSVRDASADDAPAISSLVTRTAERHVAPTLSEDGAANLLSSMTEASVRGYLAGAYLFVVAEEGDELFF